MHETGIAPKGYGSGERYIEEQFPLKDQLIKWFFQPLGELKGHQAFVAMILSLLLVEKWLRVSMGHGEQSFSENSPPIRDFAAVFGIDPDLAYRFWSDWRNGLLHRGMPKTEQFDGYMISGDYGFAVALDGKVVKVNPWRFRDRVLEIVGADRGVWKDAEAPLAKEFKLEREV